MKDTRRTRFLALAAVVVAGAAAGVVSRRALARLGAAPQPMVVEADLRDAVAQPMPSAALVVSGRAVLVTRAAVPEKRRGDIDDALLSSRRRRALARSVSVQ